MAQLTQDLERLKESYRDLYHNAPVMYFSLDNAGRLVTFNDTLVRTLGYQRRELVQRPYRDLLAPSALQKWEAHMQNAATLPGKRLPVVDKEETLWKAKNGSVLDVWIRSVPVVNSDGTVVRRRSAALDLTERNRLAHELRSRGDELQRTNRRLRVINAELEDFTHVVSHDLKEPLRTLQAYSNILAEDFSGQLGPDGFQYINHLIQASRRLGTLIDDLLTLSQAGRIKGTLQAFNLIEAVATVRNDLVGLIQRKQATVLTEGSLPTVKGDPRRVTQLLTNLVTNGLKYNSNAAPRVTIGQHAGSRPAGAPEDFDPSQVLIYVRDNGIGIDAHFHQKIFGIFRRLHQTQEYEGTGAGLAICKKIVEAHGGRIWVESTLGQGSTFYFTLPRPTLIVNASPSSNGAVLAKVTQPVLPTAQESVAASMAPATHDLGKTPVLLVEDELDTGLIMQRFCKRAGLDVTYFTNAEEAWHYLQTHQPELILLDINLPGISGVELCKKVRGELGRTDVPIVLFSGDPEEHDMLHAAGADFIVSKDLLLEPSQWQKRMQDILQARPVAQERPG